MNAFDTNAGALLYFGFVLWNEAQKFIFLTLICINLIHLPTEQNISTFADNTM